MTRSQEMFQYNVPAQKKHEISETFQSNSPQLAPQVKSTAQKLQAPSQGSTGHFGCFLGGSSTLSRETALCDVDVPLLLLFIVSSRIGWARAMAARRQVMKVNSFISCSMMMRMSNLLWVGG